MVKKKLPVRWDKKALDSLRDIYDYIKEDSPTQATRVRKILLQLAQSLKEYPEKYSKEFYLEKLPNNYRSVSKWQYKIIYEVTENEIIIAFLFHTRKDPSKMTDG